MTNEIRIRVRVHRESWHADLFEDLASIPAAGRVERLRYLATVGLGALANAGTGAGPHMLGPDHTNEMPTPSEAHSMDSDESEDAIAQEPDEDPKLAARKRMLASSFTKSL